MNDTGKWRGVSQETSESEGIGIEYVLIQYKHDIDNRCVMLVCHIVNFDVRVVASDFVRAEMEIQIVKTNCTIQESVRYCKVTPKVYGQYKWPSLQQLYCKCFDDDSGNAHNSYYDVVNCAKCYFKLCGE